MSTPEVMRQTAKRLEGHVWKTRIRGHSVEARISTSDEGMLQLELTTNPAINPKKKAHFRKFKEIYRTWRKKVIFEDILTIGGYEVRWVVESDELIKFLNQNTQDHTN